MNRLARLWLYRGLPLLAALALGGLISASLAQPHRPPDPPPHAGQHDADHDAELAQDFDMDDMARDMPSVQIMALNQAARLATARFEGRLIGARLVAPHPRERASGVVLVHELKLLTPGRDVLRIRLDAQSGAFLEVAGAGLTKARRKKSDLP